MRIALVVLFLLCGVGAFAESKPPSPSRGESSTHQNKNGDHNKTPLDDLKQTPTPRKVIAVEARDPETKIPKCQKDDKAPSEWWLIGLTAVLSLATTWLVIETRRLVAETALTSKRQAAETKDALEISRNAANAAMEQAKTSTEALKRSNRAWVGVTADVEIIERLLLQDNSASCKIRMTLRNVGVSPALNTKGFFKLIVSSVSLSAPALVDYDLEVMSQNNGITIIPGDPIAWSTIALNESIFDNNHVYVWLSGYFVYKDEFNTPHYSSFLFSFVTPSGERRIPQGNHIEGRFEPIGGGWVNT